MSLPIFINPFEDPSDIDFFEFDVYVLMFEAFDPEGTEIQFQIVEEFGDGALFYLTPDYNEVAFITDPDFEAPSDLDQDNVYEVMVRAEDRDSEEEYRTIYIHVQDVDEGDNNPPEFVSASFVEVAENPEVAIYIAEAQDPDGDTVTYEITGGADQHLFSIDPETGEVYSNDVLDFENPQDAEGDNFYEIEITASDAYSETDPHSVVIQVTDLDDTAPVLEGDVDFSVEENTAEVPYAVVAYDPEGGEITYDLGGPDGHLFQLGPDGELSFFYAPDFEAPGDADGDNVYEINIVATDEAGNESAMQTVTVTVEDLSDSAPVITSTEDMAEFFENYYDAIYTVEAIDADVSDTVTYRFSDDSPDAGYFMIDEHSGAIYPIMPFDHEGPQDSDGDNVYELAIIASDGVNDSEDPFVLYVTILNENDNVPVMSEEGAEISVPENITGTIYTAVALDDDGDPLEYVLDGADAHLFYLDPGTGELSFLTPPHFETPYDDGGDNTYDVDISATDGEHTSDASPVSIRVTTDVIMGTPEPDFLIGTSGNDVIKALASNDTLDGGLGADTMWGAEGDDTYYVDDAGDLISEVSASGGVDTVISSVSRQLFNMHLENLTLLGTARYGVGNAQDNTIVGNSANNFLFGLSGADKIIGGSGADAMTGGDGDDTYSVDNAGDVVTEHLNEGADTVQASVSYSLSNNVERLVLTGSSDIDGTGNDLNNIIIGNSANNVLDGRGGADTMWGGDGNDTYYVNDAGDQTAEVSDTGGVDTVISSVSRALLNQFTENLTLSGSARAAVGNALDNVLTGNASTNDLYGGEGADTLVGGGGKDLLVGGTGLDVFVYNAVTDSGFAPPTQDLIADFQEGVDIVDLSAIDVGGPGGAFHFAGNVAFSGSVGELIARQIGGETFLDGDINGDGAADIRIHFSGLHVFTVADLIL